MDNDSENDLVDELVAAGAAADAETIRGVGFPNLVRCIDEGRSLRPKDLATHFNIPEPLATPVLRFMGVE